MAVFLNYIKAAATTALLLLVFSTTLPAAENDESPESTFLTNTRQLTYEGSRSGEGYFSPDGKALIFQSEREPDNPFYQIYMLDLETGDSHRISPGTGKTTCSFFQAGSDQVLFASTHLDPQAKAKQKEELDFRASGQKRRYAWDYDEHMDIFSAKRDGSDLKRLTDSRGYDAEGSYSPDGKLIAFCSLRNAYSGNLSDEEKKLLEIDPSYFGEIYLMNADGAGQKRLTDWPGYDGGPFFSPDGKRIIWRHFEENGALADVYTMTLDGTDKRRITDFKAMSWAPYFHPSGKYILFSSNKFGFGNFEIFMVDAEGKREPVRVTDTDGFDGLPVFSPDGSKLCWTSNRTADKKSQLFIADWDDAAALAALSAAPMRGQAGEMASKGEMGATTVAPTTDAKEQQADFSPQIKAGDLHQMVSFLASDDLEGRMSGTVGTQKAASYISERFEKIGLQPVGDKDSYLHMFDFTAGMKLRAGENALSLTTTDGKTDFKVDQDFRPLAFSTEGEITGEVVFAGFGLSVPGSNTDDYAGLEVKDKIVLVLRYVPEQVDMERRAELNRYAGLRYKAMIAREHGAKGLLVVTGPNSPKAGELVPLSYDNSSATSGIAVASISGAVAEAIFAAAGKSLKEVQDQLDQENPHFEGHFAIPDATVKMQIGVERIQKQDYNIVGVLPATGQSKGEAVLIGAHYDHIGYGEIGSLAHKGEEGQIHNGADDNASGTATVVELAAALAQLQQENPETFDRDLIVALWSGEELGIIGSAAFAENPPVPLEKISAYVNFDMVGRLRENKLILQGVGSSSVWRKIVEKRNVTAGFNLVLQDDPYQPTDITAFYPKSIPVLAFFTGSHEDYNRPTDDAETLNYEGMERIGKFARTIIADLLSTDERPDYVKVERVKSPSGGRESMRAYFGTIPDYAGEGSGGLKLSGVTAGGPADKAGLQGGDIIIEISGKEITNIYDYTYAIDAVKIGEPVEIIVIRDGKEVQLSLVPAARE